MITIPSPVPQSYKVQFQHPVTTGLTFKLYSRLNGNVTQLGGAVSGGVRQFNIPSNAPQGIQELFVRAVAASGTESDDSAGVEVEITDRPDAPTSVIVVQV